MNDFVFRAAGTTTLLICEPLEQAGFPHAFTTRQGGVSPMPANALSLGNLKQDSLENIRENRRRLLAAMGLEDWTLVTANQIHSADVRLVNDAADAKNPPTACDALTANVPKTLLAVLTADCMPILLADRRTRAVAAVHAGWRGTLSGIVARTLERMQQAYGTQPADVLAAFGPAIQAPNFEVGPEVIAQFEAAYPFARQAVSNRQNSGKAHLDLAFINRQLLVEKGVPTEQIYDCGFCTVERNDLFFSYRKENGATQPVGRLMGVIGRAGN